ncbi:hypothetical protein ACLMJK_000350 [Lecanora helva]
MSESASGDAAKLTLYRGWLDRGQYTWSPFVNKLEARLRFAGVSYKPDAGSVLKAPRAKIPYVDYQGPNSAQSEQLPDSTLIIERLVEDNVLPNLNARLSLVDRVHDLAIRSLLEEKLYSYRVRISQHPLLMRELWEENYYNMREKTLCTLPYPLRVLVGLMIYRKVNKMLVMRGINRYTADEIRSFRDEIWSSVNVLLGESKGKTTQNEKSKVFWILGGDEPTEADATLFGFIMCIFVCKA